LVTGGAHPIGIGLAAAKALLCLGYQVIVTGISEAGIAATPKFGGIEVRALDVTDQAAVDALVNCAGGYPMRITRWMNISRRSRSTSTARCG